MEQEEEERKRRAEVLKSLETSSSKKKDSSSLWNIDDYWLILEIEADLLKKTVLIMIFYKKWLNSY